MAAARGKAAVGDEVFRSEYLGGVLAAAEGVDGEIVGDGVAELEGDDVGVDAAHAGATAQDEGVSVIAVGAQDVGQDEADGQLLSHERPP